VENITFLKPSISKNLSVEDINSPFPIKFESVMFYSEGTRTN